MDNINEKARFATQKEFKQDLNAIRLSESTADENGAGIPLFCEESEGEKIVYVDKSDAHSLILGATGSKKTRLIIMPSILLCAKAGESFIVVDPKGELYNRTAQRIDDCGYNVITIDFRNPRTSDAWNPLYIPFLHYKNGEHNKSYEFLSEVARSIFCAVSHHDTYWIDSALKLFVGLALFTFEQNKHLEGHCGVSISDIIKLREELFTPTHNIGSFDDEIIWAMSFKFDKYLIENHPIVYRNISNAIEAPPRTRANILGFFDLYMETFSMHEDLLAMTAKTTFQFTALVDRKTAIYIILPDEKPTYHILASIFVKQCYDSLIAIASELPDIRFSNRINFIVDEFASLPSIPGFPTMITASRSRNIRFHLVAQSQAQLKERYGYETETIMSNCSNWIFLFSRETALLNDIQTLGGNTPESRPLLPVSLLQNLLKDVNIIEEEINGKVVQFSESEVLVLSGRKRPYISHLFDINHYDYNDIPPVRNKPVCESVPVEKCFSVFAFWDDILTKIKKAKEEALTQEAREKSETQDAKDISITQSRESREVPTSVKSSISKKNENISKPSKIVMAIDIILISAVIAGFVGMMLDFSLSSWTRIEWGLAAIIILYFVSVIMGAINNSLTVNGIQSKGFSILASILGLVVILPISIICIAFIITGLNGARTWLWWGWFILIVIPVRTIFNLVAFGITANKNKQATKTPTSSSISSVSKSTSAPTQELEPFDVLEKYAFPSINNDEYEFALIKRDGKIMITDQGKTLTQLDKIFELGEQDVINNLVSILNQYGARKVGAEFVIEIDASDNEVDTKKEVEEAKLKLYSCVSFMMNMKIFYV